ncbi:MAG: hypothetical protein ABIF09_17050, partial [Gemmatimonadota bacterium]
GSGLSRVRGCAWGGAGEPEGLPALGLVEVILGNGVGLGGIEVEGLVEVVGERFLGGLFYFPTGGAHVELGLGRSPGWMDKRG